MIEPRRLQERGVIAAATCVAGCCRAGLKLLFVVASLQVQLGLADDLQDQAMIKIATTSGCALCHNEGPRNPKTDVLATGPSWNEIAKRYRAQPNAEDRLTGVVISGSGQGPKDRHWGYKVSGVSMPSNLVEISPDDARKLVRWILAR